MQPMLATSGDRVPGGDQWIHEIKWDGMRVLVEVGHEGVRAFSRNENEVSVSFPELQRLAAPERDVLLDGELIALDAGVPSFGALAERMHVRDERRAARLAEGNPVTLIVFDVLRLDGTALLDRPLRERRTTLEALELASSWSAGVCQVPPTYDDGSALFAAAEEQGLEGIVSKRLDSRYHPGRRSREWLKFPIRPNGSYVVGGFRLEQGSDSRIGALLVGEPGDGGLRFRGRVGSGVAGRAGQRLVELLEPLTRPGSPFVEELPRTDVEGTIWVDPEIVIDVQYLALTRDGRLRQPAYRGLRTDLAPDQVEN